eukprot:6208044-Pleurochrysis_carterae.AAC.5
MPGAAARTNACTCFQSGGGSASRKITRRKGCGAISIGGQARVHTCPCHARSSRGVQKAAVMAPKEASLAGHVPERDQTDAQTFRAGRIQFSSNVLRSGFRPCPGILMLRTTR